MIKISNFLKKVMINLVSLGTAAISIVLAVSIAFTALNGDGISWTNVIYMVILTALFVLVNRIKKNKKL
jgi:hypothetical protein